jgi:hypothetical protein
MATVAAEGCGRPSVRNQPPQKKHKTTTTKPPRTVVGVVQRNLDDGQAILVVGCRVVARVSDKSPRAAPAGAAPAAPTSRRIV